MYTTTLPKAPAMQSDITFDWQAHVIDIYRHSRRQEGGALQGKLAAQVRALIGRPIAPGSIYVDLDERLAQAVVDGIMFRWRNSALVVVRPCAACGSGQFESPALNGPADVGYALSAWQPLHSGCQLEDPVDWLYSDS
jgi:hypothetical protein